MIDSSKCKFARKLATASNVAFGPKAMRAGSPGMIRAMVKMSIDTPISTMKEVKSRLNKIMKEVGIFATF